MCSIHNVKKSIKMPYFNLNKKKHALNSHIINSNPNLDISGNALQMETPVSPRFGREAGGGAGAGAGGLRARLRPGPLPGGAGRRRLQDRGGAEEHAAF